MSAKVNRRNILAGGAAALLGLATPRRAFAAAAELGIALTEEQLARGEAFLLAHPSVDCHAHPGRFLMADMVDPSPRMAASPRPFVERAVADLHAGHVSAALWACAADLRLLYTTPAGALTAREFEPGEARRDYERQIGVLKRLAASRAVAPGLSPADILVAAARHETACVFAVEGGDFLEGKLERVAEAHADGVRAITVVHYHNNQIGDVALQPLTPGGLTVIGRALVREMNRVGIIVDVAHGSPLVVRGALEVATKPLMVSHANLNRAAFEHARLLSAETAKLVASAGGVIGSVPSGLGQKTFGDWIESILRLVELVGAEHVAIGTDMDANFAPVFASYRSWPLIPAALLARGVGEGEAAAIMGGNFLRLFRAVVGVPTR